MKGRPRFLTIAPMWMRGADGCLLIFDVTIKQTLNDEAVAILEEWVKVNDNSLNKKPPIGNEKSNDTNIKTTPPVILVGTKVILSVPSMYSVVYV